jgi:predicted nucleic acid-binding OB-fold protein
LNSLFIRVIRELFRQAIREESSQVLDYIAAKRMVGITADVVEEAVNELLGEDRFIEPER